MATVVKVTPTNTVKFGIYAITLEKDQLNYYTNGKMTKVIDVNPSYTRKDLFELAERISAKNGFGLVEYTHKEKILNHN